jgi:hypothetical protein
VFGQSWAGYTLQSGYFFMDDEDYRNMDWWSEYPNGVEEPGYYGEWRNYADIVYGDVDTGFSLARVR